MSVKQTVKAARRRLDFWDHYRIYSYVWSNGKATRRVGVYGRGK